MPEGKGWRIRVGPNGRIIEKRIVDQDRAGVFLVLSKEEITEQILKEIRENFRRDVEIEEPDPRPPFPTRPSRLRAA
jgi:hypothetical protein